MVELKKTKCIYAMKVIKKALVTDDEVSLINIKLKYKCNVITLKLSILKYNFIIMLYLYKTKLNFFFYILRSNQF